MIEAIVRLMLDVQHSGMPVTVRTKRGDTSRILMITLMDGGNQYKFGADCQAVLAAKKPDGTVLFNNCSIDNNVIRYEFTEQTCAVAGNVISEIRIYGGGKLLTSASFVIEVLSTTVSEDDVISTDEMNALDALYLDTKALKDEIQQKLDNGEFIGPPGPSTAEALDAANRARESANTATQAAAASAGAAARAEQAAVRAEAGAAKVEHIEKTAEEANAKVDTLREVVSKFHSNIQETVMGEVITVSDASDLPLAGLKVFGKTEQNGIPTPDAPVALESVGDDGSVNVTVCGKNLLKTDWTYFNSPATEVTCTVNSDGSVTLNGTATQENIVIKANVVSSEGVCILSSDVELPAGVYIYPSNSANSAINNIDPGKKQCTIADASKLYSVRLIVVKGTTLSNFTIRLQLEQGSTATAYEPYKDGGSLALSTPNGLPGIPVTSGGNYTDPVTQKQWICDEVDFEKGVYVQNVYKEKLTNAYAAWDTSIACEISKVPYYGAGTGNPQLCSHMPVITYGQLGSVTGIAMYSVNGAGYCTISKKDFSTVAACQEWLDANEVYVVYRLLNPIYHNLSEIDPDALAQYAALHSNYPNTTVFNDKNAGMEVKYVADTKLYVDKKFNELAAALVSKV